MESLRGVGFEMFGERKWIDWWNVGGDCYVDGGEWGKEIK